jgi:hypothetical protein
VGLKKGADRNVKQIRSNNKQFNFFTLLQAKPNFKKVADMTNKDICISWRSDKGWDQNMTLMVFHW